MPIFQLKPIAAGLDHQDWSSCTFRGVCWVNAASEADARGLASGKFQDGGATITGLHETPSPWRNPELVEVSETDAMPNGITLPENTVLAGD